MKSLANSKTSLGAPGGKEASGMIIVTTTTIIKLNITTIPIIIIIENSESCPELL